MKNLKAFFLSFFCLLALSCLVTNQTFAEVNKKTTHFSSVKVKTSGTQLIVLTTLPSTEFRCSYGQVNYIINEEKFSDTTVSYAFLSRQKVDIPIDSPVCLYGIQDRDKFANKKELQKYLLKLYKEDIIKSKYSSFRRQKDILPLFTAKVLVV